MTLESLEPRLAPAGLITATLTAGGALTLTGDALDNSLTLAEAGGSFQLTGDSGTLIRLNGGAPAAQVSLAGVIKSLTADFKGGNDLLVTGGLNLTGNLTVNLGAGANALTITDAFVGGALKITGGAGADNLEFTGLSVTGATTVNAGAGDNVTSITNTTGQPLTFGKGFSYTGGAASDSVTLAAGGRLAVGGALSISTGAGASFVTLAADWVDITGSLALTTGAHTSEDTATVYLSANHLTVGGSVAIRNGSGLSSFQFTGVSDAAYASIRGGFSLTNGANAAGSSTSLNFAAMAVGGSFTIAPGGGTGVAISGPGDAQGSLIVGGSLTVSYGSGGGETIMPLGEILVGGSFSLSGRAGLYTHEIRALHLQAGGGISVTHQASPDTANMSRTYFEAAELIAPAISINNSSGSFETLLSSPNAQISGGVLITNGPTGSTVGVQTVLQGNWDIGGSLEISNAAGQYVTRIDSIQAIHIGKDLVISNGAGNELGVSVALTGGLIQTGADLTLRFAHGSGQDVADLAPTALIVGDDLTISHGNTAEVYPFTNRIAPADHLFIGGDVLIRNGSGEFAQVISAVAITIQGGIDVVNGRHIGGGGQAFALSGGHATIGGPILLNNSAGGPSATSLLVTSQLELGSGLTVINGAGDDVFVIEAASTAVGGSVLLRNGAGQTETRIGSDPAGALAIRGGLTITSMAGDDSLYISGTGRIGGAVTASFGLSDAIYVDLVGAVASGGPALTLAGPVSLTASANATRGIGFSFATVLSALNITGGSGADTLSISDSIFAGPVNLSLLAGDDLAQIDRATFRSAFTFAAGAGTDSFAVGLNSGPTTPTQFLGLVTVRLEAGDDTLTLGQSDSPAIFHSRATFDGGAGIDVLDATITSTPTANQPRFLAGLPTVTNFE